MTHSACARSDPARFEHRSQVGKRYISGGSGGLNYLRGDEGDDSISGGAQFDDINGNMGNDTCHGYDGDDWVVGGKDNDMLFGDAGDDIVWGNLGNDTLNGGSGADQVRGGQGDDVLFGGSGNDFISGDRGNDTETGGAGADRFHDSQDAGIDKVMDFNYFQGDRVQLDPGTTFTASQVGADTVLDMGGGNQMILVGVNLASLPPEPVERTERVETGTATTTICGGWPATSRRCSASSICWPRRTSTTNWPTAWRSTWGSIPGAFPS